MKVKRQVARAVAKEFVNEADNVALTLLRSADNIILAQVKQAKKKNNHDTKEKDIREEK